MEDNPKTTIKSDCKSFFIACLLTCYRCFHQQRRAYMKKINQLKLHIYLWECLWDRWEVINTIEVVIWDLISVIRDVAACTHYQFFSLKVSKGGKLFIQHERNPFHCVFYSKLVMIMNGQSISLLVINRLLKSVISVTKIF